jgi:hypothetical protein
MRPTSIIILGHQYEITYVENPVDVDINKRECLFGQIDYWTRTIRIYTKDRRESDILETLIHEILHAIETDLKLDCFKEERGHDELDIIATALTDTFIRNGWILNIEGGTK